MARLDRITSDPSICHGQTTVRALRYPVANLLEPLASGMTKEILEDHPDLERDDLLAALEFGALCVEQAPDGVPRRCGRFLLDAQLPARLARQIPAAGHAVVHTSELPEG